MANNRKRQMLRTAGADRLRERVSSGDLATVPPIPSSREARRAAEREARRSARRDVAASGVPASA